MELGLLNLEQLVGQYWPLLILITAWSLCWKGVALWKASHLNQRWWFIALLVVNTIGLLEIIYILAIARPKERRVEDSNL